MNAVFLACCLCCAQAPDNDPLLKQLDADFEQLLKAEKDPQPLREAARLLGATDSASNWTNYSSVTTLLRRSRARAAVPLLLAYLVRHADERRFNSHIYLPAYVGVLELLTGKEIGPLYKSGGGAKVVRQAVERLVNDWWKPHKDRITTDIGKMTDEQVQLVTDRLLAQGAGGSEGAGSLTARDVHPRMIAVILARTGYLEGDQAKQPPRRDTFQIPQEAVPILATLRKDGEAPGLEKIAGDDRQNSATRLLCLMALSRAGEDIPLATLLGLLEKEKKLDRRLRMIQMIGELPDAHKATPKLLALLDDPNMHVRTAALTALSTAASPEALPKLRKMLDDLHPQEAVRTVLATLGKMGTPKAKEALATFLEAGLEEGRRAAYLYDALSAFETATGQSWTRAGAYSLENYRQQARAALKWWRKQ